MDDTITLGEALERLEQLLPTAAPKVWDSLRPPVTPQDLDMLRRNVAPNDLHSDLVEALSWRDGQTWGAPFWPVLDRGHLIGAEEASEHYGFLRREFPEQWPASWVPVTHDGWWQAGLEHAGPQRGLVIDGSFPDPPRPLAPSLTAVMHATCDMIDAGFPLAPPSDTPDEYLPWRAQRDEIARSRYEYYGGTPADLGNLADT